MTPRIRCSLAAALAAAIPLAAHAQVVAPLSFGVASAATPPLIPEATGTALANELSGSSAKRNLEYITRLHRMRASKDFRTAAEFVAGQARLYGLQDVKVHELPADGHTMYGTQKARLGWDPEFAELWEVRADGARTTPIARIASFEDEPVILAEDSDSADVTAEVVDVGVGDDDLFEGELVAGEGGDDAGDVVAGIDDDGLACDIIPENRAVALQHSDGQNLVDHKPIVGH